MNEFSKENLLRSWKEIAAYLGCDVRTCHRWESRRGMPVHRAEGSETRSPVFAYRDELDRWFKGTFTASNNPKEKARRFPAWAMWAAVGVLALVAAAGLVFRLRPRPKGQPADFSIEGPVFIALDKQKRELWRKDTGLEDLRKEAFYRRNFQVINKNEGNLLPVLIIRDINSDGDNEVVFAPRRERDQTGEGWIFCYDRAGTQLWKFHGGKELRCGGTTFSPDYRIAGFVCRDLEGDGRLETIVESFHAPHWPCQLAVLDPSGRKTGEFWNAGYLRELVFKDINGDGREELIVCGVNNEYRGCCLIGFDTRKIGGSSPQSGGFICQGLGKGSELFYLTTPMPDVAKAEGEWLSSLVFLDITDNGWIRGSTNDGLIYDFDFGLKCIQLTVGHTFMLRHQELAEAGKIKSVLGPAYLAKIREGIRYWDGEAWTAVPSMVRR